MIEKIVLDYLSSTLTETVGSTTVSIPVSMEVPEQPTPKKYVVIEKTGSNKLNHVPTAFIAVQSYAETLLNAATLNEQVKAAMDNIVTLAAIGGCHLDTDYNFTDPSTKTYRYQAVFRITYMEAQNG